MRGSLGNIILILTAFFASLAQPQEPTTLKHFLEKRLSDPPNTSPPPYEALLRVVDSLGTANGGEIQASLPLLSLALKSNVANLPVEAVLAIFAIAGRPDGAKLLSSKLDEIALLMQHSDERISGGSATILSGLTGAIPDSTVPLLLTQLRSPRVSTLVKTEIIRTLLVSPKIRDQAMPAIRRLASDPTVDEQVRAMAQRALQNHTLPPPK